MCLSLLAFSSLLNFIHIRHLDGMLVPEHTAFFKLLALWDSAPSASSVFRNSYSSLHHHLKYHSLLGAISASLTVNIRSSELLGIVLLCSLGSQKGSVFAFIV